MRRSGVRDSRSGKRPAKPDSGQAPSGVCPYSTADALEVLAARDDQGSALLLAAAARLREAGALLVDDARGRRAGGGA